MGNATRPCMGCGEPLPPMKYQGNPRKWCSEKCRVAAYYVVHPDKLEERRTRARERARTLANGRQSTCTNCQQSCNNGAAYCSTRECQLVAKRERASRRYHADKLAGAARIAANRAAWTDERRAAERERARRWRAQVGYYESKRAADVMRRARRATATVERFGRAEILERDGWRCGICGKRIRKGLAYPHPKSPSIDHVIPLSHGGEHSRANVRAAHLDCNVTRGATGDKDQLALFG